MILSGFKYTGVLDKDLQILYCDAPPIFHKLLDKGVRLRKKLMKTRPSDTVNHSFRYGGVRYFASFYKVQDHSVVCRISRMISDELPRGELINDLDAMLGGVLASVTMAQMIKNYALRADFESIHSGVREQIMKLSDVGSQIIDIRFLLSAEKRRPKCIQLRKWLLHTSDVIGYAAGPAMKRITLNTDVPFYAVMDYFSFQLALYNLAKLAFICGREGSTSSLSIFSCGDGILCAALRAPFQQSRALDRFAIEMHTVKRIFSVWGGHFDFYEQDGYLCGSGYITARFPQSGKRLKNDISVKGSIPRIMKRRSEGKFRKLYFVSEKEMFRSDNEFFSDVEDQELMFAKLFFDGIDIER